jgi:hypothetical protein
MRARIGIGAQKSRIFFLSRCKKEALFSNHFPSRELEKERKKGRKKERKNSMVTMRVTPVDP